MAKPATQTRKPANAKPPSGLRTVVEMAASAADRVNVTHNPCNVQVMRKRRKETLSSSKRASFPLSWTRRKRKVPRRPAQTTTNASSSSDRPSTVGLSNTAISVTVM